MHYQCSRIIVVIIIIVIIIVITVIISAEFLRCMPWDI